MNKNRTLNKETVHDTVARLRAHRKQPQKAIADQPTDSTNNSLRSHASTQQKVSKNSKTVSATERKTAANEIIKQLLLGELTQGQALKKLRVNILGLKQDVFAKLVDVSRKTLSDIENDRGSYNTDILNKVFKPFALKVGILPSPSLLSSLISETKAE